MSRNKQKASSRRPNHKPQLPADSDSSDKSAAPKGPAKRARRKRAFLICLVVAGLLAALEYGARLHDDKVQFRFQLLKALDMFRGVKTPLAACPDSELGWPEGSVFIRDPDYNPPPGEPYVLGGKVIPEARPDARQIALRPDPADGRKRFFILGESAAFGFPLGYGDSFAAHLERGLGTNAYQVLNAGEPGWYSGILVPAAYRIVDHFKPEVLVLYMGNNEWIHWFAADEIPNPRVVRIFRALAGSRAIAYGEYLVFRWLVDRMHSRAAGFDYHHELLGFDYALQHPLNQSVSDWEDTKQSFLANFESNLLQIINYAKARNVRVILLTVPFCYKLSPAWKHSQPLAFSEANKPFVRQALDQAAAAYRAKDFALALEKLEPALAREPSLALLHHLKAAALEAQGKLAEAEASYAMCREKMIGNLGSMLSINQSIRKAAAATGTQLLDLQALFDTCEHAQGRYFNEDLILDDCHPTPLGHRLIAQNLLPLLSSNSPPASVNSGAPPVPASATGPSHQPAHVQTP